MAPQHCDCPAVLGAEDAVDILSGDAYATIVADGGLAHSRRVLR